MWCNVHNPSASARAWITCFLVLSMVVTGLGVIVHPQPVAGQSLDELQRALDQQQDKLESITNELKSHEQDLKEARSNQDSLENRIAQLLDEIGGYEQRIYDLQDQLGELDGQLAVNTQNLQAAEDELKQRTELAGRRVRALQESGTVSVLEVLVASRSFTDFLTRFSYLQQMLRQDVQLLYEVKDEKAKIEVQRAELEDQRAKIAQLKTQATSQLASIAAIRDQKEAELVKTNEEIEKYKRQIEELEQLSEQIQKDIQKAQAALDAELKKRGITFTHLSWPLPPGGWISSPFGNRWHPILQKYKLHTGLDIAIKKGTPIYAAGAGKVITAGSLGGYGLAVMIAHGKGIDGNSYVTLYGHTSKIYVKVGDYVKAGQHIANVGSTGLSTGPHLHFEVRVNGVPTNPLKFVSKP